jgi:hypothetical protein
MSSIQDLIGVLHELQVEREKNIESINVLIKNHVSESSGHCAPYEVSIGQKLLSFKNCISICFGGGEDGIYDNAITLHIADDGRKGQCFIRHNSGTGNEAYLTSIYDTLNICQRIASNMDIDRGFYMDCMNQNDMINKKESALRHDIREINNEDNKTLEVERKLRIEEVFIPLDEDEVGRLFSIILANTDTKKSEEIVSFVAMNILSDRVQLSTSSAYGLKSPKNNQLFMFKRDQEDESRISKADLLVELGRAFKYDNSLVVDSNEIIEVSKYAEGIPSVSIGDMMSLIKIKLATSPFQEYLTENDQESLCDLNNSDDEKPLDEASNLDYQEDLTEANELEDQEAWNKANGITKNIDQTDVAQMTITNEEGSKTDDAMISDSGDLPVDYSTTDSGEENEQESIADTIGNTLAYTSTTKKQKFPQDRWHRRNKNLSRRAKKRKH